MAAVATVADVAARWTGSTPLPEDDIVEAWLGDAETVILAEFPDILDRMAGDDGDLWRSRVVYVATQLTIQALKNPDMARQRARTAGEFTDSVTYGAESIAAAMTLTPAHRAMLSGGRPRHSGIDMTGQATQPTHPLAGAWVNGPAGMEPGRWRR